MSTNTSDRTTRHPTGTGPAPRALRMVQAAAAIGAASSIAFAAISVFTTTSDGGDFKYTADYWYTSIGIPIALAGFVLLVAVHTLQRGREGRIGYAGLIVNNIALLVLTAELAGSVVVGSELRWGPAYLLATAATFVGLSLFAAGSWSVGLVPRWLLALWPVVWVIGSFLAQGASPLLLAAFFCVLAAVLTRHVTGRAQGENA